MRRRIGETLRDAIDWAQETLRTTRPLAEQVVRSAIQDKAMIMDNGIILLEDDEDMERRKIASVQSNQHSQNAAKKWTRIHFRNHNRSRGSSSGGKNAGGKNSLSAVHKQAAGKFSDVAESMLAGAPPAALPSSSVVEESRNLEIPK